MEKSKRELEEPIIGEANWRSSNRVGTKYENVVVKIELPTLIVILTWHDLRIVPLLLTQSFILS